MIMTKYQNDRDRERGYLPWEGGREKKSKILKYDRVSWVFKI
jgi:hypothetical protein